MTTGGFLNIQPTELKFPFELRRQSSCSMQLTNRTDQNVAFKVKTTNPKKYSVRPNSGVIFPGTTCNVTVTMQAQKEAPPDMQCKDKFLVQSVVATTMDMTPELFTKEGGKVIEEVKLRVIYIPANLPSPVPEGSEEGSPSASVVEDQNQNALLPTAVARSLEEPKYKPSSSEEYSMFSKSTEEKASAIQENQQIHHELELMRKEVRKSHAGGFLVMFAVLIGVVGVLVSYLLKKT